MIPSPERIRSVMFLVDGIPAGIDTPEPSRNATVLGVEDGISLPQGKRLI
jgi:hypothetical protein